MTVALQLRIFLATLVAGFAHFVRNNTLLTDCQFEI